MDGTARWLGRYGARYRAVLGARQACGRERQGCVNGTDRARPEGQPVLMALIEPQLTSDASRSIFRLLEERDARALGPVDNRGVGPTVEQPREAVAVAVGGALRRLVQSSNWPSSCETGLGAGSTCSAGASWTSATADAGGGAGGTAAGVAIGGAGGWRGTVGARTGAAETAGPAGGGAGVGSTG